jgi:hypothetical protein
VVSKDTFCRLVLQSNGIVDLLSAVLLIVFPVAGLPIPGYPRFESTGAFVAGGWGGGRILVGDNSDLGCAKAAALPCNNPVGLN